MSDLHTDVRYIKGIGEARAKALAKLGITIDSVNTAAATVQNEENNGNTGNE